MSHVVISNPPFTSIEEFDALMANVQDPPAGLQYRWVGIADGQVRLVAVWESEQAADTFFAEHLTPALKKAFGSEVPPPQTVRLDAAREYIGELVG